MITLVVSNQRGGVGKTTTAVALAGYLSTRCKRVLLMDVDSQGSAATILGIKPNRYLYHVVVGGEPLEDCVTRVRENFDLLASNRDTQRVETSILGQVGPEMSLKLVMDNQGTLPYDAVVIDVAPSVTGLHTCAMVYARNVLIPVAMDMLSLQGASMSLEAARLLNQYYKQDIRVSGFLPTQVNARLATTKVAMATIESMSKKNGVPVLPAIRVDQSVHKAAYSKQLIWEYDGAARACQDYTVAFDVLLHNLEEREHAEAHTA